MSTTVSVWRQQICNKEKKKLPGWIYIHSLVWCVILDLMVVGCPLETHSTYWMSGKMLLGQLLHLLYH